MKNKDKPFYIFYQWENRKRPYFKKRKEGRHNQKRYILKSKWRIFRVSRNKARNR